MYRNVCVVLHWMLEYEQMAWCALTSSNWIQIRNMNVGLEHAAGDSAVEPDVLARTHY